MIIGNLHVFDLGVRSGRKSSEVEITKGSGENWEQKECKMGS